MKIFHRQMIPDWKVTRTDKLKSDVQKGPIIVAIAVFFLCLLCRKINSNLKIEVLAKKEFTSSMMDIFLTLEFTVSLVSISLMTYMAESVKDRILGISYKRIFLKDFLFWPNYITLVVLILICNCFALICYVIDVPVMSLGVFIVTYMLIVYLMKLTYIMYSKKSLVYKKIIMIFQYEKSVGKNRRDEVLKYFLFKSEECVRELEKEEDKGHNPYLTEELYLLYCLAKYVEEKCNEVEESWRKGLIIEEDYKNFNAKKYSKLIKNLMQVLLQADCRTFEKKKLDFNENGKLYNWCKINRFLAGIQLEKRLEIVWDYIVKEDEVKEQKDAYKTYIVTVQGYCSRATIPRGVFVSLRENPEN